MALTAEDKKFVSTVMKRTVTRSVTRIVTQILAETVQPQLNLIRQDLKLMDSRITALEVRLTSLEKSVWGSMEGLKIYMETQFRRIDSRFDRNMLIEDKQSEKSE